MGSREYHFMADELMGLSRLLETRCNRRLDTFGTQVLFKLQSLLVVIMELMQVLCLSFCGRLELAEIIRFEIADFLRVAHLEVDLIRMEAKSFHLEYCFDKCFNKNK